MFCSYERFVTIVDASVNVLPGQWVMKVRGSQIVFLLPVKKKGRIELERVYTGTM